MVTAALAADLGVTATVAQSMQVIAFFLSDTTTGGTTSKWYHDHKCDRSWKRWDTPQPNRHSDLCVRCTELTVELRPVDEGNQRQCLCAQLKTRRHRLIC